MKYQIKVLVTVENPDLESNEAKVEAERIVDLYFRAKNSGGVTVGDAKLTFSVCSGAVKVS